METLRRTVAAFFHTGWFYRDWYKYLGQPVNYFHDRPKVVEWASAIWCRATGHRNVHWYNPYGTEPDMHCVNCGDDLG